MFLIIVGLLILFLIVVLFLTFLFVLVVLFLDVDCLLAVLFLIHLEILISKLVVFRHFLLIGQLLLPLHPLPLDGGQRSYFLHSQRRVLLQNLLFLLVVVNLKCILEPHPSARSRGPVQTIQNLILNSLVLTTLGLYLVLQILVIRPRLFQFFRVRLAYLGKAFEDGCDSLRKILNLNKNGCTSRKGLFCIFDEFHLMY